MADLVVLPTGQTAFTVRAAADAFLASLGNPNTVRNYGIGIGKTALRLGEDRPLAAVADEEIGEALELLWGSAAVNTWNAAGPRSARGWSGAATEGTGPRRCRSGPSGCRCLTPTPRSGPGWRSTG
ncbi:hypothetical protein GCM10023085_16250 [Actinomadura viridis]|uniref:Uncharacterized protein n=1 Tax=Actinomadura viridis TaxID=58110 RepID=A0A931GJD9_9ACTN|nr:hypothetical protein [Actinomadura viridis]MBG6089613.1 hypothetical protein [Actinomadura viridis]